MQLSKKALAMRAIGGGVARPFHKGIQQERFLNWGCLLVARGQRPEQRAPGLKSACDGLRPTHAFSLQTTRFSSERRKQSDSMSIAMRDRACACFVTLFSQSSPAGQTRRAFFPSRKPIAPLQKGQRHEKSYLSNEEDQYTPAARNTCESNGQHRSGSRM